MDDEPNNGQTSVRTLDVVRSLPRKIIDYLLVTGLVGGVAMLIKATFVIPLVGIGVPFDIDSFKYTIERYECRLQTLDEAFSERRAQGEYCTIDFQVANTSNMTSSPFHEWTLILVNGDRFSPADDWGGIPARNIFPGNFAEGTVAFDIPKGAEPAQLYIEGQLGLLLRDRVNVAL